MPIFPEVWELKGFKQQNWPSRPSRASDSPAT